MKTQLTLKLITLLSIKNFMVDKALQFIDKLMWVICILILPLHPTYIFKKLFQMNTLIIYKDFFDYSS